MNEKSNKLISLLGALDRAQLRKCRKLVSSPYFGGNGDLLAYFDVITEQLQKGKSLEKTLIWRRVHGKSKPFSDTRFRKFSSDLFKLTQEYLVQERLESNSGIKDYLYLEGLEFTNPDKLVHGKERNWEDTYKVDKGADQLSFLTNHLHEVKKERILKYERRPNDRVNLTEINRALDVYFIFIKLKSALDAVTRKRASNEEYEINFIPDIIRFLETRPDYLDYLLLGVQFYLYKMNAEDQDESHFYSYKKIIEQRPQLFTSETGYSLLQPALNYCARKINQGAERFLQEYLFIYRFALPDRLLFEDGILDPQQFRATVTFALRSGEFNWAEYYIKNYAKYIPQKERSNAESYNLATLFFYKKDYDQALLYLRDVEYNNFTYNLNAKSMLLAIYYETQADDVLDSLFDAVSAYINRHKEIPGFIKTAFRNLVSYTRRLTRMLPGDTNAIEKLRKDVTSQQYVASRPWLEEKIKEFEES